MARRYAPGMARYAAGRIQKAWRGRKRKRGVYRPSARASRRFKTRPPPAGRSRIFATSIYPPDTLFAGNIGSQILRGADPGDRLRNYVDLIGIKIRMIAENNTNSPDERGIFHVCVAQDKSQETDIVGNTDNNLNFFSDPSRNAEGYGGINFNDLSILPYDKNMMAVYKRRWTVFMHKKISIMSRSTSGSNLVQNRIPNTQYRQWYVPVKQRIWFDPTKAGPSQRPINILYWWEPYDLGASNLASLEVREHLQFFFKKSN